LNTPHEEFHAGIFKKASEKITDMDKNKAKNKDEEYMERDVEKWLEEDGEEFLKGIGIKQGQTVLDFGCGEGHYAIPAAKLVGEKGKVYAVDKDEQALHRLLRKISDKNIKSIEVIKEESKTSLENNLVDFIVCFDVLHYVKERKVLYYEFKRVLRQKGILSLYPKHHKNDHPLMEFAHMKLGDIIKEVEEAGFSLKERFSKRLIHDDYYNQGYILNFKKEKKCCS
jgi:ubiquinone/menaquinone biosynthesis C-methylase UbiE